MTAPLTSPSPCDSAAVSGSDHRLVGPLGVEGGINRIEVTIAFPVNWMPHIKRLADDALRGRDSYWLKQLAAKIVIAAMPRPAERPNDKLTPPEA